MPVTFLNIRDKKFSDISEFVEYLSKSSVRRNKSLEYSISSNCVNS